MPQLQEHVRIALQRTDISAEAFLEMRSPIRHAIGLMIAAYNHEDQVEGTRIFEVCKNRLTGDCSERPSNIENTYALGVLYSIWSTCECLLNNQRQYRQQMNAPLN
ncbi:MAG TPA: hypothetical protein DEB30_03775 [Candidatus Peribacter riflensis]|uniref:Uncharacterized protein n=1 Tax=Candidatus Peribacter riflensis TaxID=1735162 RepID=A0A0S1SSI7_9BACT|nr:MAG: hypothetical protein PeribacterA2_0727 [Candidatus Peribacter riflensis]OGJ77781.1 MAG: hypothetical protein A2398_00720 [Candidatus Peribacteria bacterium RIFOXYB1_FULL_57_12]OGJ80414.1 MAG: hypothetical protein A2412_02120 [Candidatus Peribacteria bacterium RIFOXYC1_FULL_58_8]ALM11195.1 MAG: hypothetical protein PeribacterB2_0728 [Candidatus Peribacter riflensis]ALM12298.1 MAG: hypothetical protein PeribacterC2_0728 [Candidatus Peribacter riflensis]